jgi:hypothetical protein
VCGASPEECGDPGGGCPPEHPCRAVTRPRRYFKEVETVPKVVFNCVPSAATTAMMATAIPAAMRPYSMAVAADWSSQNVLKSRSMVGGHNGDRPFTSP